MLDLEEQELIRRYAAGGVTRRELRERGFEDYVQVLGALGELGLRPPIAPIGRSERRGAAPRPGADSRGPERAFMTPGFSLIVTDTSPLLTADFILDRARPRPQRRTAATNRGGGRCPGAAARAVGRRRDIGQTPSPRILVIGDVMTDVIVRPEGPIARGSDRRASIVVRTGRVGGQSGGVARLVRRRGRFRRARRRGRRRSRDGAASRRSGVTPHLVGDAQRRPAGSSRSSTRAASAASSPTAARTRRSKPPTSPTR